MRAREHAASQGGPCLRTTATRPAASSGSRCAKVDAAAKVTGQTLFADDLVLPRMVFARLLRSPHPHARIRADRRLARGRASRRAGHAGRLPSCPSRSASCPSARTSTRWPSTRSASSAIPWPRWPRSTRRRPRRRCASSTSTTRSCPPLMSIEEALGPRGRAHPRLRAARQRAQGGVVRLRRRGGGLRRGRPRARGHLLLRGQHPPAPGAARGRGVASGPTAS